MGRVVGEAPGARPVTVGRCLPRAPAVAGRSRRRPAGARRATRCCAPPSNWQTPRPTELPQITRPQPPRSTAEVRTEAAVEKTRAGVRVGMRVWRWLPRRAKFVFAGVVVALVIGVPAAIWVVGKVAYAPEEPVEDLVAAFNDRDLARAAELAGCTAQAVPGGGAARGLPGAGAHGDRRGGDGRQHQPRQRRRDRRGTSWPASGAREHRAGRPRARAAAEELVDPVGGGRQPGDRRVVGAVGADRGAGRRAVAGGREPR